MKIHRLKATNIKRLSEVDLVPGDTSLVIVGGNNGAGKTSVLDSIWMALGGAQAVPERPIRDGEESAEVSLDLGDWTVTRRWTRNGTGDLSIRNRDGDSKSKPQAFLDSLVGPLSFDPLAFSRMRASEQAETLRALVGLDTRQLDAVHARVYEERRAENRELKAAEARLAAVPEVTDAPPELISVSALTANLQESLSAKADYEREKANLDRMREGIQGIKDSIADLEAKLKKRREDLSVATTRASVAENDLHHGRPFDDIEKIQAKINEAEALNQRFRALQSRKALAAEVERRKAESARLTAELEEVEAAKAAALAAAPFPVPGLSIDGETVTFNAIPFAQASESEKLRVSLAMGLAMNPKLKVVLIRDGSLLDKQSLAIVEEMAQAAGAQVWLERVGEDGPTTYVIEEGRVKEPVTA